MAKKIDIPESVWAMARTEYTTSEISIRQTCKKYNVPYNQALNRCNAEGWNEKKKEFIDKSIDKSIELVSDQLAVEAKRAYQVASRVLGKIEEVVDNMDVSSPTILSEIKDVTVSMKNLKDIGFFKASLDEQEQIARIEKLRKEVQDEQSRDTTITVKIESDMDEFAD